jgi:hypothetical protein
VDRFTPNPAPRGRLRDRGGAMNRVHPSFEIAGALLVFVLLAFLGVAMMVTT